MCVWYQEAGWALASVQPQHGEGGVVGGGAAVTTSLPKLLICISSRGHVISGTHRMCSHTHTQILTNSHPVIWVQFHTTAELRLNWWCHPSPSPSSVTCSYCSLCPSLLSSLPLSVYPHIFICVWLFNIKGPWTRNSGLWLCSVVHIGCRGVLERSLPLSDNRTLLHHVIRLCSIGSWPFTAYCYTIGHFVNTADIVGYEIL